MQPMRSLCFALCAAALAGCAGGDKPFLPPDPPVAAGKALLVVYRTPVGVGDVDVTVDGKAACVVASGSAFARQLDAGKHTLTADSLSPGLSVLKFDAAQGQTVFVRIAANGGRLVRGFIPVYGWVNSFVEAEKNKGKPHGNVFSLDLTTAPTAYEDLKGTSDAGCSRSPEDK